MHFISVNINIRFIKTVLHKKTTINFQEEKEDLCGGK